MFRLVPGQSVTIGRAPTNQIVLKDERCSRNHVEVFCSGGQWTLRDLDSRNGTLVGNQRVSGDWPLQPGDMIRIGHSQLVFVHRLAEAFSDSSAVVRPLADGAADAAPPAAKTTIPACWRPTSRRRSRIAAARPGSWSRARKTTSGHLEDRPGGGQALPPGLRAGQGPRHRGDGRPGPARAVRRHADRRRRRAAAAAQLPAASRVAEALEVRRLAQLLRRGRYHRVSHVLASTVMREGEAVLARNVMGDSTLGSRDSHGEIHGHQRDLRPDPPRPARCSA